MTNNKSVLVERSFKRRPLVAELLVAMRSASPDERLTVTESIGNFSGQSTCAVRDWIPQLEGVAKRQADGYFTVGEAAQLLADAHADLSVKVMISRMAVAKIGEPLRRLVRGSDLLPSLEGAVFREELDLVKVDDVDEWLASQGVPYRLAALCPLEESAPQSTRGQVPGQRESAEQRQDRRLSRFQQLGGLMKRVPGAWNVDVSGDRRGKLAELVKEEKAARRPRSDRKDISADLAAAAERQQTIGKA